MRQLGLAVLVGLGCAGVATPPPAVEPVPAPVEPAPVVEPATAEADAAWIAAAVDRAVDAETMPGTTGEDDPQQREALRQFFLKHPEYADPAKLDRVLEDACDVGVAANHERLLHPPPRTPAVVDVTGEDWRVVVTHTQAHCTSDDWSYYTSEVGTQLEQHHVSNPYASADNDVIVVKREGREVVRVPVPEGAGFLALRAGHDAVDVTYGMTPEVMPRLLEALELGE